MIDSPTIISNRISITIIFTPFTNKYSPEFIRIIVIAVEIASFDDGELESRRSRRNVVACVGVEFEVFAVAVVVGVLVGFDEVLDEMNFIGWGGCLTS